MPRGIPSLQFHARTYETVGATPEAVNPDMQLLLAERERECGVTFPPSVREWYLCGGPALGLNIGCGPTADSMYPLHGLGQPFGWYNERPEAPARRTVLRRPDSGLKLLVRRPLRRPLVDDLVRTGLLKFLIENQGVCGWAVKLDGSDDPPVMYEIDSREPGVWKVCAESFSTFMYSRALDFGHCLKDMAVAVSGFDRPLAPGDLKLLQSRFAEGPRTYGLPGHTNYRFFAPDLAAPDRAILLYDDEIEADWHLVASSDEALLQLLSEVWHCGTLRETLRTHHDLRSQQVLDRARSGM
jgi:hypothetical protein